MEKLDKKKKNASKELSIELFAFNPKLTIKDVANKLNISERVIRHWREEEDYHASIYKAYMKRYDSKIPAVMDAMFETAINDANVNAAKLILEQGGKLIKNIFNVTVSPYEMFIEKMSDVEIVDEDSIIEAASDIIDIDAEKIVKNKEVKNKNDRQRSIGENKKIKDIKKLAEYNEKQREWYKWRKRAKEVGIEPLKSKRPTSAQRRVWQEQIIIKEGSVNAKQESKREKNVSKS